MRIFYPGQAPSGANAAGARKPEPTFRLDQLDAIWRIHNELSGDRRGSDAVERSVLCGAGMGSGKTAVSVEVMIKLNPRRALVVGVRDAYSQWEESVRDQQTNMFKRVLRRIDSTEEGLKHLSLLLDGEDGWYYVGLEMLRAKDWETVEEKVKFDPKLKAFFGDKIDTHTDPVKKRVQKHTYSNMAPVDLLISDEAHRHSSQKADGLKTLYTIRATAKLALSGTFFGNRFENAWSLTTWLWGKAVIGTKGAWEARFAAKVPVMSKDGKKQLTTPGGFPLTKITGEVNPGEFVSTLPCYVYIASPLGPAPDPEIVRIDLGPESRRQYDEMRDSALTRLWDVSGNRALLVADLPLTQRLRLRTAALGGMTLVPGLAEEDPDSITFLPNCDSSTLNEAYNVLHRTSRDPKKHWKGKKALILTHSRTFAIEAARRISGKYTVALKTGDTPTTGPNSWDEQKRRFMLPVGHPESIQYLVAVISAVGTAMDGLQFQCSKVLWLSEDDNNTNNIQGSNRIWRDGVDLEEYAAAKIVQRGTISSEINRKNLDHKEMVLDAVSGNQS